MKHGLIVLTAIEEGVSPDLMGACFEVGGVESLGFGDEMLELRGGVGSGRVDALKARGKSVSGVSCGVEFGCDTVEGGGDFGLRLDVAG